MNEILLILLVLCSTYALHLKTKLNVALYSLNKWREMVVSFNGKQRLLDK